jgi:hypothetical protein
MTDETMLERLAERTYILPRADGFKLELAPALVSEVGAAIVEYASAIKGFDGLAAASRNLQAATGKRSGSLQALAAADMDILIDRFATSETPELPPYAGDSFVAEYARLLRAIADLVNNRFPVATRRAVRAQGKRLLAGSHLLTEIVNQRVAWVSMLLSPAVSFEAGGEFELTSTETGRLRKLASEMSTAGANLIRQVDAEHENAGAHALTFNREADGRFEWLFKTLSPLWSRATGE